MSQEKVNSYKESKANRKAEVAAARKRKARNKVLGWAAVVVIAGGLLAALVVTGINIYTSYVAGLPSYDAEALVINNYVEHTTEAESTEAESTEAESTEDESTEAASEAETTAAN